MSLYKNIFCTLFWRFKINRSFWNSWVSYLKRCFS